MSDQGAKFLTSPCFFPLSEGQTQVDKLEEVWNVISKEDITQVLVVVSAKHVGRDLTLICGEGEVDQCVRDTMAQDPEYATLNMDQVTVHMWQSYLNSSASGGYTFYLS